MRMIERWFPCAEVSEAARQGWGSAKSEKALFVWFATRPLAQAKAAVLTSLLPWPDEPDEQRRLQNLVRKALTGYDAAHAELVQEIDRAYPQGAVLLDPFSGRAVIPLEAARLGVRAWGIDYSPVATLAGTLLADYPLRNWSSEPSLPFEPRVERIFADRLLSDVRLFLDEIGRRFEAAMASYYPKHKGEQPWGYLWAATLPCQECGRRFPISGSVILRHPLTIRQDTGQSYQIDSDIESGTFRAVVHDGPPIGGPTLLNLMRGGRPLRGKVAVCPFCHHVHPKDLHTRLAAEGQCKDILLVAADLDDVVGKFFREPTDAERSAVEAAEVDLIRETPFGWPLNKPGWPDSSWSLGGPGGPPVVPPTVLTHSRLWFKRDKQSR